MSDTPTGHRGCSLHNNGPMDGTVIRATDLFNGGGGQKRGGRHSITAPFKPMTGFRGLAKLTRRVQGFGVAEAQRQRSRG